MGFEGIVAKRRDKPYRSGRSPDWIKIKNPDASGGERDHGVVSSFAGHNNSTTTCRSNSASAVVLSSWPYINVATARSTPIYEYTA
jgi:hypothetical protein